MNNSFTFFICLIFCSMASAEPEGKFTLLVVNENGVPIEGAETGILAFLSRKSGTGWGSNTKKITGLTDTDGLYVVKHETQGRIDYFAKKDGYYSTSHTYKGFTGISGILGFRRWQPWNPTIEVELKEIKAPIPLYAAKIIEVNLPKLDEPVGFDLIQRDWVVPYGRGVNTDILFTLVKHRVNSPRDYHVDFTIGFPNKTDGIQLVIDEPNGGSILKLPHNAPIESYQRNVILRDEREEGKFYNASDLIPHENHNYFFRVRTETNDKGEIENALYGKTDGPIRLEFFTAPNSTGKISFTYYLNPTPNDTNLEFDIHKNKFKNLTNKERVGLP